MNARDGKIETKSSPINPSQSKYESEDAAVISHQFGHCEVSASGFDAECGNSDHFIPGGGGGPKGSKLEHLK